MKGLSIFIGLVATVLAAGGCTTNRPTYGTPYAAPVYSGTTYVPSTVPPPGRLTCKLSSPLMKPLIRSIAAFSAPLIGPQMA